MPSQKICTPEDTMSLRTRAEIETAFDEKVRFYD
jgi:hypothetical protein